MRPPINWFGGKARLAKWLVTLIPEHTTYVEVFGGSGALLFAKEPSAFEIYNDIDDGLINLYRVLRDPEQFAKLETMLRLTLYSRAEFVSAMATFNDPDPIRRAWAMFVSARMARGSVQRKMGVSYWRFGISARRDSAAGGEVHLPRVFANAIKLLGPVHERLQNVVVESDDWRRILARYDRPETFFYLDPPYVTATRAGRTYYHDWIDADHVEFLDTVKRLRGKVAISGYDSALYLNGLPDWIRHTHEVARSLDGTNSRATEIVWCNYV